MYPTHYHTVEHFLHPFETYYENKDSGKIYIFFGNIKVDILHSNRKNDNILQRYLNVLSSKGFISCMQVPIRIKDNSESTINDIFVKYNNNIIIYYYFVV